MQLLDSQTKRKAQIYFMTKCHCNCQCNAHSSNIRI